MPSKRLLHLHFHRHRSFCLLLSLTLLCVKGAVGAEYRISSASEYSSFVNSVNKGMTYSGATVYLDSDLTFTGKTLDPIGVNVAEYFSGTFDGQGHVISNLKMTSSSLRYAGLFGYSTGLTIRNVVLDSSCSIANACSGSSDVYIGGIIGYCDSSFKKCGFENIVNMARVTFSGAISKSNLAIGGIIGWALSSGYGSYMVNCANYGSIVQTGTSHGSYIGGLAGILYSDEAYPSNATNCVNYGAIMYSDPSPEALELGGITGYSCYAYIENCVSAGEVSVTNAPETTNYVGSLVGTVHLSTHASYCYYTSDVGISTPYGFGTPDSETATPSSSTAASSAVSSLNSRVTSSNGWNKWLLNANGKTVTFRINDNDGFSLSSSLIILPNLASDWRGFAGWFSDDSFTASFSDSSVSDSKTLYGRWDTYAVTLDANGGIVSETSKNMTYNSEYGELPTPADRTGYTFSGWYTEKAGGSKVTPSTMFTSLSDRTIYAHWTANNYTLRFIFDNGTEDAVEVLDYSENISYPADPEKEGYRFDGWDNNITNMPAESINITARWVPKEIEVTFDVNGGNGLAKNEVLVTYNSTYDELPEAAKEGYMFVGWFTDKTGGTEVTNETTVTIADNHTLYARWEKITAYVEIVFSTKSMTKEEAEKVIREHVSAGTNFTIVEIFNDEGTGEIRVIVNFIDTEKAEEFVRSVNKLSRDDNDMIKHVGFVSYDNSPSVLFCPALLLFVAILL